MIVLNQQTAHKQHQASPLSLSNPLPGASGLDLCSSVLLRTQKHNVVLHEGFF